MYKIEISINGNRLPHLDINCNIKELYNEDLIQVKKSDTGSLFDVTDVNGYNENGVDISISHNGKHIRDMKNVYLSGGDKFITIGK